MNNGLIMVGVGFGSLMLAIMMAVIFYKNKIIGLVPAFIIPITCAVVTVCSIYFIGELIIESTESSHLQTTDESVGDLN